MPVCNICGETIPVGSRTCPLCGSAAEDFGSETIAITYSTDPSGFHAETGSDPIDGPYCVDGDVLTLTNALGWPFWLLDRN